MSLANDFEYFCSQITPSDKELKDIEIKIKRIVKKLNQTYYEIDSDSDHLYTVGSVGRDTAISNISDYDIIFDLPHETFLKFNSYNNNGQSYLLQEVKKVIKETYPSTDIKGDGQVIVVQFTDYKIEVVPGFKESDDRFKYPDSNDGGHWKYTDPIPEKNASLKQIKATNNNYKRFANILRSWKNNVGFKFKGLLIDTLVYNYFEENQQKKFIGYVDYLLTLKSIFNYLQNQDENQSYWYALGSNQQIINNDKGLFIKKAKKAYSKIEELDENDDVNQILQDLLGNNFPVHNKNLGKTISKFSTEEFI
ncbi:SMODS domain-containing nucleotidyltransferase, partial [Bombilactobacillus bombi]|uniref:SMODS domain-containing nucleotidyltransferase n=1 Tax=Bombilactobacillus bombi TaxID=1303590 RepID=UPI0015E5E143